MRKTPDAAYRYQLRSDRAGRPRARLAVGAFAFAAAVDVVLPASGVLLTRVSTRSAVSRSVNRMATVARSVSRDLSQLSRQLPWEACRLGVPFRIAVPAAMPAAAAPVIIVIVA